MSADFCDIDGCVFDAYGTLFDLSSAIADALANLGDRADDVATTWRSKQIEYTQLRSLMGRHSDFEMVTRDPFQRLAAYAQQRGQRSSSRGQS